MNSGITQLQAQPIVKDHLSRPLRDLRISVIDRCNYRCPYCMPEEVYGDAHEFLPRKDWLTSGELKRLAGLFLKLGVNKLRLTGGAPVLRRDLGDIVRGFAALDGLEDLALTNHGSGLPPRPQGAQAA